MFFYCIKSTLLRFSPEKNASIFLQVSSRSLNLVSYAPQAIWGVKMTFLRSLKA